MKVVRKLLEVYPKSYSEELGINLSSGSERELFKWFLASLLFAKPIRDTTAKKTYNCFKTKNVLSGRQILKIGWNELVKLLDSGSYTRYDFSTADKLLEVAKNLEGRSLNEIYKSCKSQEELETKLRSLGKGVGGITIQIFLRELRGIWKVDSLPSEFTLLAARKLKIIRAKKPQKALEELKKVWKASKINGKRFVNFETALLRLGKDYCRKQKCKICKFFKNCKAGSHVARN